MDDSGTWVPYSPLIVRDDSCRKTLDASRLFTLQKKDGFSFKITDEVMVSKLAVLEDLEVKRDGSRGSDIGDQ